MEENMEENKNLKIFLISIIAILGIAATICATIFIMRILNKNKPKPEVKEPSKYSEKATAIMNELDYYDLINSKEYSKTIEIMLENEEFEKKYLNEYLKIEYQEITDFSKIINDFLTKDYKGDEINYILKNQPEYINNLLNMDHINILEFQDLENFDQTKLERYLNYKQENAEYDIATIVTYVNIGLDKKGYSTFTNYTIEEANNNITILVNKYHKLPDNYIPSDLVDLSYGNGVHKLRKEAAAAFEELTSAAILDNVIFYPFSAYRSYEVQNILYNRYKARDGEEKADTYSARPGFSEHQLGLSVDVRSSNLNDNLTKEHYEWMLNNSYKYGFIVRYPKGKQHITQFIEEPWHIRYLGVDLATKVHEANLTYDEYYDLYMTKNAE